MSRAAISILLPTYNCAAYVRDALESVKWADEILVIDSYSSDGTLDICREFGSRIIQHEYVNSAKQKNWALPQCQHEWVFQIDTDEVICPQLKDEIEEALATVSADVDAFRIPRRNHVLGRFIRFGGIYPDFQTRLMRRDHCRWQEREVHAHVVVRGKTVDLRHDLLHFGMPNLSRQVRNLDRYTGYEADEMKKLGITFRWYDLVLRPWLIFLHRFVWQQGWRDGYRGIILCAYLAMYEFLSRAKLWELEELRLKNSPR